MRSRTRGPKRVAMATGPTIARLLAAVASVYWPRCDFPSPTSVTTLSTAMKFALLNQMSAIGIPMTASLFASTTSQRNRGFHEISSRTRKNWMSRPKLPTRTAPAAPQARPARTLATRSTAAAT